MLSNTPESLFEQVPGVTCVKHVCYQLCDVFQYESEFEHANSVILSCGINDLSRYGKTAHSLIDNIRHKLESCCKKYRKTNFIFNSVTHVKDRTWLNREISVFNDYIYNLSKHIPNLSFYDSHAMIMNERYQFEFVYERNGNGIHLCFEVQKFVARGLVSSVGKLIRPHSGSPRFGEFRWLYNARTFNPFHG